MGLVYIYHKDQPNVGEYIYHTWILWDWIKIIKHTLDRWSHNYGWPFQVLEVFYPNMERWSISTVFFSNGFCFPHMGVSKNSGTPKSPILIGFSIINHPFWGTPILGNTHIEHVNWNNTLKPPNQVHPPHVPPMNFLLCPLEVLRFGFAHDPWWSLPLPWLVARQGLWDDDQWPIEGVSVDLRARWALLISQNMEVSIRKVRLFHPTLPHLFDAPFMMVTLYL